jgi:hypothetical protein
MNILIAADAAASAGLGDDSSVNGLKRGEQFFRIDRELIRR